MSAETLNTNVNAGIHPLARKNVERIFSDIEKEIVKSFENQWYVTKADFIKTGASEYKYILIKAPHFLAEMINIVAEIIVVFSSYENFEPRTLDVFDNVKKKLESGRIENLCGVILSNDNEIESKIKLYNSGTETRTYIPCSYDEIIRNRSNSYFFRQKFQTIFYSRDLFAFDDALKTDLYFFGRNQLVMGIIDKHLSGQNSGLFGLRKTGKTSIIYDVKRKIKKRNAIGVFISCQSPEMSMGTHVDSIFFIIKSLYEELMWDCSEIDRETINELNACSYLLKEIQKVYSETHQTILFLFDEVEHITYGKAASERWREGLESVYFWKAFRSAYQKENSSFTFCIVGTNPICIEYSTIHKVDNPIFSGVTPQYIHGFDVEQTRSMIRKLGRIMGLKFEETLFAKMTEDYGGHPFLIRHLCSFIATRYPKRPVTIDRIKYKKCIQDFNLSQGKYFDMLLEVLIEFYQDEYDMLRFLATGEIDFFKEMANADYSYVEHLIGYDLIQCCDGEYDFKIDVIKDYIMRKETVYSCFKTDAEKWSDICTKRNKFETELRNVVKKVLQIGLASKKIDAKEYVVGKIYNDKESKRKCSSLKYSDLFDPRKCNIYLKDLKTLILGQWDIFSPYISFSQEDFIAWMNVMNQEGRFDAHAKVPDDEEVALVGMAIKKLETIIDEFNQI